MDIIDTNNEDGVLKCYKEKPYFNFNKEPFGLILNGNSKDYINAHEIVKGSLKKGKEIKTPVGKIKILDASIKKGMVVAIVEVTLGQNVIRGNAELKVHNPSVTKKKGATIEIRKISDFKYTFVENLEKVLSSFLDRIIDGEEVEGLGRNTKKTFLGVTSNPKLFTCDKCDWQTKFGSALKGHKKRMHGTCQTQSNDEVKDNTRKRTNEDTQSTKEQNKAGNVSPSSSPPRKKLEKEIDDSEEESFDLNDEELNVEKEINKHFLLQKRIKELESQVALILNEKKRESEPKLVQIDVKIPKHLNSVNRKHLEKLKGFIMMYKTIPNGASLKNSLAVHVYEDEKEGENVKRRINHHVADNWDNYYQYKIPLPYKETVAVGANAFGVEKKTREEMLKCLRSEESLDGLFKHSGTACDSKSVQHKHLYLHIQRR